MRILLQNKFYLIAKSNALRRSHKQKLTELESLGEKIAAKAAELRRL